MQESSDVERRNISKSHADPFLSSDVWIQFADLTVFAGDDSAHARILTESHIKVIFFESEQIFSYMDTLARMDRPYILITSSNTDISIPYGVMPCEDEVVREKMNGILASPHLLRWFTKNPGIVHPKLQPVPLGPKWQWRSCAFFGEDKQAHLTLFRASCLRPEQRFQEDKPHLLYFNFNVGTTSDPPFVRANHHIRSMVRQSLIHRFEWVPNLPFDQYVRVLGTYRFCLSPPGCGVDTHRTWEALMSGTIPIMFSSPLDELYRDLPVIIFQDVMEMERLLTETWLNARYAEMRAKAHTYRFDIMYSPYWAALF